VVERPVPAGKFAAPYIESFPVGTLGLTYKKNLSISQWVLKIFNINKTSMAHLYHLYFYNNYHFLSVIAIVY